MTEIGEQILRDTKQQEAATGHHILFVIGTMMLGWNQQQGNGNFPKKGCRKGSRIKLIELLWILEAGDKRSEETLMSNCQTRSKLYKRYLIVGCPALQPVGSCFLQCNGSQSNWRGKPSPTLQQHHIDQTSVFPRYSC